MEQTERIFKYKVKESEARQLYENEIQKVLQNYKTIKLKEGEYSVPLEEDTFGATYYITCDLGEIEGIEENLEYATIIEDGMKREVLHELKKNATRMKNIYANMKK